MQHEELSGLKGTTVVYDLQHIARISGKDGKKLLSLVLLRAQERITITRRMSVLIVEVHFAEIRDPEKSLFSKRALLHVPIIVV